MLNAKSFMDGDKFVVSIENATINNVKVTTFDDNGRLVLVFESIKSGENTSPISSVIETSEEAPSDAKPLPKKEEDIVETQKVLLSGGKYDGEDPWKLLDNSDPKEAEKAFLYLAESIKAGNIADVNVAKEVKLALNSYLYARFCNCDAYEYAGKLTEKQCAIFFKRFDAAISSKIKSSICNQYGTKEWDTFLAEAAVDVKRSAIAEIINKFKGLKL